MRFMLTDAVNPNRFLVTVDQQFRMFRVCNHYIADVRFFPGRRLNETEIYEEM